jgi:hypothetical protein
MGGTAWVRESELGDGHDYAIDHAFHRVRGADGGKYADTYADFYTNLDAAGPRDYRVLRSIVRAAGCVGQRDANGDSNAADDGNRHRFANIHSNCNRQSDLQH